MRLLSVCIVSGIALISQPLLAAPGTGNNSYAAFDAGPSVFNGQSAQDILTLTGAGNTGTPSASSFTNSTAYRLTGGYQLDPNWGIEVSYVDLGESDYSISQSLSSNDTGGTRAWGWGFSGVGTLPLNDHWSLFARFGATDARVTLFRNIDTSIGTVAAGNASTEWRAMFGAGIGWSVADDWTIRLGWDQYHALGSSNHTGEVTANMISVGIVYSFPLTYGLNGAD
ncbi:MAG: outer membrane beta-barrel protein [Gammaproteobacteria bacterium]